MPRAPRAGPGGSSPTVKRIIQIIQIILVIILLAFQAYLHRLPKNVSGDPRRKPNTLKNVRFDTPAVSRAYLEASDRARVRLGADFILTLDRMMRFLE